MQDIKKLVEETFLETLEVLSESDDHTVIDNRRWRHSPDATMTKLKKGMSDHEKKHMKGAYTDGADIVHEKSSKTMSHALDDKGEKSKNFGQVRKEIQAHIAKHHPEVKKSTGPVKHDGETRSIVTASDEHANKLKTTFHGKNTKVRLMKRKTGNKVYIDSKSKEHHDEVKSKLDKMKHS